MTDSTDTVTFNDLVGGWVITSLSPPNDDHPPIREDEADDR